MARKNHNECPECGYVIGATCGYKPLTRHERDILYLHGCALSTNVHKDEIATIEGHDYYSSARYVLHGCHTGKIPRKQTRFDVISAA